MSASVLVTRPREQADALCTALRDRGIQPLAVPTVAIDRESTAAELDALLSGGLDGASWLVITSANGAEAVAARMVVGSRRLPPALRLAAVGPATAAALSAAGLPVHHVPDRYLTTAIAGGLGDVAGRRVVLARADAATPDLRDLLVEAGAAITEVVAYRTIEGPISSRDALREALATDVAGIAFTSGSTVRGLLALLAPSERRRALALPAFCIGPVTARTAAGAGFRVAVVADEHTARGLAHDIADHLQPGDSP